MLFTLLLHHHNIAFSPLLSPARPPPLDTTHTHTHTHTATKNVPLIDGISAGSSQLKTDITVTSEYQDSSNVAQRTSVFPSSRVQNTDVWHHSKNGSAFFNYRMKFTVELPARFPRLKLKIWDWERWRLNQYIGEVVINLAHTFGQAHMDRTRKECQKEWYVVV